ncbi:hypothetical protein LINPERHAP2_LOCUS1324, partial [Linum perenne]
MKKSLNLCNFCMMSNADYAYMDYGNVTNSNNKRVMLDGKMNSNGNPDNAMAAKRTRRNHFSGQIENHNFGVDLIPSLDLHLINGFLVNVAEQLCG